MRVLKRSRLHVRHNRPAAEKHAKQVWLLLLLLLLM